MSGREPWYFVVFLAVLAVFTPDAGEQMLLAAVDIGLVIYLDWSERHGR